MQAIASTYVWINRTLSSKSLSSLFETILSLDPSVVGGLIIVTQIAWTHTHTHTDVSICVGINWRGANSSWLHNNFITNTLESLHCLWFYVDQKLLWSQQLDIRFRSFGLSFFLHGLQPAKFRSYSASSISKTLFRLSIIDGFHELLRGNYAPLANINTLENGNIRLKIGLKLKLN